VSPAVFNVLSDNRRVEKDYAWHNLFNFNSSKVFAIPRSMAPTIQPAIITSYAYATCWT